jgi:hypothetical protein
VGRTIGIGIIRHKGIDIRDTLEVEILRLAIADTVSNFWVLLKSSSIISSVVSSTSGHGLVSREVL